MLSMPWIEKETIGIKLPPLWDLLGSYSPLEARIPESFDELLEHSLDNPIGMGSLEEIGINGKKITIVIDDSTRPTPVHKIFPTLLRRLSNFGVSSSDVTVIVALGTHAPMSETNILKRLGVLERGNLTIINHDCLDDRGLVDLGTTSWGTRAILNRCICESDLTILIGTIEPHLIAGFGGGLKNVIPGCAGMAAIAGTHLKVTASDRFGVVGKIGEACPTRLAIEEGALRAPCEYFMINTVLNGDGTPVGVFSGHPVEAHRLGCLKAASVFGSPIREKADILISSAWPMNFDFRQATKCLANGMGALKEGGLMIALMACSNGVGDVTIGDSFQPVDEAKKILNELGAEAYVDFRLGDRRNSGMDEVYMLQFLSEIYRRYEIMVYAPDLPELFNKKLGLFPIYDDLDTLFSEASRRMPSGTVLISPFGGTCYPVLA